ncbi:hypothetical protein [Corynebacterium oculi]|uniref:Uncharacterized protein n=1 Tax=Corynebacterium oculi TaxID=1544416 RepID=A0A0Q0UBT8_9CORY|nr:hypothetical protein [Corynebacterium oculi]KQB83771.1 hypothetical protein Cocul_01843 [Corynebacterium oculi]
MNLEIRSRGQNLEGWWEEFNVENAHTADILYAVIAGNAESTSPEFPPEGDPVCLGIYTTQEEAEIAVRPRSQWSARNRQPTSILPFRLGWKRDEFFPDGRPWPPTTA